MALELLYPLKPGSYYRVRGYQDHVNSGTGPWYGIDDGCLVGTELVAVEAGVISNVEKKTVGGGWSFRLNLSKYPGWFCWYAHCSALPAAGKVSRGQVIARSGATGSVTGPHLHHSLIQDSKIRNNDSPAVVRWDRTGGEQEVVTEEILLGLYNGILMRNYPDLATFKAKDPAAFSKVGKNTLSIIQEVSNSPERGLVNKKYFG